MSDDQSDSVHSIINQLRAVPTALTKAQEVSDTLTKDNLEEFIIKHTGNLVKQASDSVSLVKDYVETAPNSDDVAALAELIKATSTAIESLNKILITDKKSATSIKIQEMNIKSRQEQFDTAVGVKLMLTREELMKQLLSPVVEPKQIDITVENVD